MSCYYSHSRLWLSVGISCSMLYRKFGLWPWRPNLQPSVLGPPSIDFLLPFPQIAAVRWERCSFPSTDLTSLPPSGSTFLPLAPPPSLWFRLPSSCLPCAPPPLALAAPSLLSVLPRPAFLKPRLRDHPLSPTCSSCYLLTGSFPHLGISHIKKGMRHLPSLIPPPHMRATLAEWVV